MCDSQSTVRADEDAVALVIIFNISKQNFIFEGRSADDARFSLFTAICAAGNAFRIVSAHSETVLFRRDTPSQTFFNIVQYS